MHSCHERTDRFLTRGFNSNHINPPLGTVGVSTRQALSQPLCCLGSVLVYRGSLRESGREMGMNEWLQGSLKCHYVPLPALCKDAWLCVHQIKLLYKAKFKQLVHSVCVYRHIKGRTTLSLDKNGKIGKLCRTQDKVLFFSLQCHHF